MGLDKIGSICLLYSIGIWASVLVVTSDVATNTTWDKDTVIIDKEYFEIKENARLTIAPGSRIIFKKDISIVTVFGTIIANGTENDSIHIQRMDPSNEWQGIRLVPRNKPFESLDTSSFEFCNFRNAFSTGSEMLYERQGGALHCGKGNFTSVKYCNISYNWGDIGGALYLDSGAVMQVENCIFTGNKASFFGGGAIMTCGDGSPVLFVQNCRFEYNYARSGGAIRIGKGTTAEINNCIFYRDTTHSINPDIGDLKGGALAIFGPANVTLRNCIIFFCRSYDKGGGIYSQDASIKLINCTIARNSSIYGGGIYFARDSAASSPLLVNTIEYVNGSISSSKIPRDSAGWGFFLDSTVTPVFKYCHLYDTVYDHTINPYQGKFENSQYYRTDFVCVSPFFKYPDTVVEGYQLSSTFAGDDPGINGGTPDTTGLGLPEYDLLGQKRIYGDAVDIGAIEYNDSFLPSITITRINKQPRFNLKYNRAVIYTLNGRKVDSFSGKISMRSLRESAGGRLPKGMYIIALYLPGRQCKLERLLVK